MAKVGLKGLQYAILDATLNTYGTPASLGKGVSAEVSVKSNDAKLYADDALAESDVSFSSATVNVTVDDDRNEVLAPLLGHTVATGEVVRNANDIAPYVGLGRIVTKIVDGVRQYKVEFLCKVKFKEPNQSDKTKGDSVEFTTMSLEGDASTITTGVWSKTNTFDTEAEAQTYIETCFGIVA